MNATVCAAINDQINSEFKASYTYLAMAAYCESQKFLGAANWLRMQSEEERQHGLKLFDFVLARDGVVALKTIEQPKANFDSLAAVFEQALEHEQKVTVEINALYELCFKEKAVRRDDRAAVVSDRAGRRRENGARDRGEVSFREERSRGDARHGPRTRVAFRASRKSHSVVLYF
jgi:bacterioferritin (cytochrome b1)